DLADDGRHRLLGRRHDQRLVDPVADLVVSREVEHVLLVEHQQDVEAGRAHQPSPPSGASAVVSSVTGWRRSSLATSSRTRAVPAAARTGSASSRYFRSVSSFVIGSSGPPRACRRLASTVPPGVSMTTVAGMRAEWRIVAHVSWAAGSVLSSTRSIRSRTAGSVRLASHHHSGGGRSRIAIATACGTLNCASTMLAGRRE